MKITTKQEVTYVLELTREEALKLKLMSQDIIVNNTTSNRRFIDFCNTMWDTLPDIYILEGKDNV